MAFNLNERFLDGEDESGFARLVRWLGEHGILEVRARRRYRHRDDIAGNPLHYVAIVAAKRGDMPEDWVESL